MKRGEGVALFLLWVFTLAMLAGAWMEVSR